MSVEGARGRAVRENYFFFFCQIVRWIYGKARGCCLTDKSESNAVRRRPTVAETTPTSTLKMCLLPDEAIIERMCGGRVDVKA